ncbi:hypothetical protein [Gimesia algae]|uniref:Haem-binding uptake Tiki superfamily ChaN domain-containing protein n=1 Tax=Gimesia algae TaxID=2527971 RepID=A0A517VML1_9PLAN|nr:hypothetical protein [Gimesia algae]QDT94150.1 hypothetical protein Pan161_58430 [Gimesia algae]
MSRLFPLIFLLLPLQTHAEPTKIIHILNWHYVSRDDFAADLRTEIGKSQSDDQIDKEYLSFLDDVKAIQKEQAELLRRLIKKHDLNAVYVEGLTEKNHKGALKFINTMKNYEATRQPSDDPIDRLVKAQHHLNLLEAGAAARLVMTGELKTLLPAEDSKAMEAANPVQADGSVVIDKKADEAREDAIVKNLMKADGVVVIILGGGHDLSDNIKRAESNCKYERVAVPKYRGVME